MPDPITTEEVIASTRLAAMRVVAIAREDPATFVEYVVRDEQTGQAIKLAPMHQAWHDLISEHRALVIHAHVEAGKSQQIAVGRVLWELGRNSNLHMGIISSTSDRAEAFLRAVAEYIDRASRGTCPELAEVFPNLRPSTDPSMPWTTNSITVERGVVSANPSVKAYGVEALVPGPRLDFVVMDDILTMENTRTQAQRDTLWTRLTSTLFTRLTPGSRVVCVGNAWHPDDALHRMVDLAKFHHARFPVLDANGEVTWPVRWTHERVEEFRVVLGSLEFARMLMCVARDDATARIQRDWVDRCLRRGQDLKLTYAYTDKPPGRVYTGMDLAISKKDTADKCALFTLLTHQNGDREVVNVENGRWSAKEILERLRNVVRRYGGIAYVESVGMQDFVVQVAREPGKEDEPLPPVYPFVTGAKKHDPVVGVESIAAELEAARWIIPSRLVGDVLVGATPAINEWIAELLAFDPNGHTGDSLMASYFAREAARADDAGYNAPRTHTMRHSSELERFMADPEAHLRPRALDDLDLARADRVVQRKLAREERDRVRSLRAEMVKRGLDPDKLFPSSG